MKIGILTFHCAHNYGAVIQCYGLQQYLVSLGHQVYVIDYRPHYFDGYKLPQLTFSKSKSIIAYLKSVVRHIAIGNVRKKRHDSFERFIAQELNLKSYVSGSDYSDFDAIILGSDQIWNPQITGGHFDDEFFGYKAKCRVISYAASSKFISLLEEQKIYLKSRLERFDKISVRESSLKELLQPLVGQSISTVIDPSFLPEVSDYEKICKPIPNKEPYVLIYEIDRHSYTYRIAKEIAKLIGARVVELTACVSPQFYGKRFKMNVGPIEFLSYIKNASCVVTTSFHGMALSLKFEKDFYSIRQGTNADLRAESLLSKLDLLSHFIPSDSSISSYEKLDYSKITPCLNEEIKESKLFLMKSLEEIE